MGCSANEVLARVTTGPREVKQTDFVIHSLAVVVCQEWESRKSGSWGGSRKRVEKGGREREGREREGREREGREREGRERG